jgi:hypothetical protein
MEALKPFVRDLMTRMERDLDTELDWVAVGHYNTGHPHSHIRGQDELGKDLIMTRDYVSHGNRHQAQDLVTPELGPELDFDRQMKMARDVDAERVTRLDRTLLAQAQDNFLVVSAMPPDDTLTHAAKMGRLRKLQATVWPKRSRRVYWNSPPILKHASRHLASALTSSTPCTGPCGRPGMTGQREVSQFIMAKSLSLAKWRPLGLSMNSQTDAMS